ncbi:hypothetical protein PG985_009886 [Apiospora marii]|uniref:Uncharacterized protein n=1 Tax=Apiospora marii TaxID=335849 RepID=A0ABR1RQI9_9PEZI
MPSSIIKSMARVGSRATEVAKSAPFITLPGSRRTSWMAFEQPNPSKIMATPVSSPPHSPPRGDGGDRPEKPPNASSTIDRLAKQQAFLEWFIFAAESEVRRRTLAQQRRTQQQQQQRQQQKQKPYYELPTTRLCIPDHPATFGCAPAARLNPRLETRVGETPAPVRVWKYDYEVERAVTERAQAKAERERVKAKRRRLRVMYREALQETMGHD